jgi:peptidoglycan glycosyltransferase
MATSTRRTLTSRERRLLSRAIPLVIVAVVAFVVGLRAATGGSRRDRDAARSYVAAWARQDWSGMYGNLSASSRARISAADFTTDNQVAAATATVASVRAGDPDTNGDVIDVPVTLTTRVFGTISLTWSIPVKDGKVGWRPELVFPGLRAGEQLNRLVSMPPRATILARDGTPLAKGPDRSSPETDAAAQIVGELGTPPPSQRLALRTRGYPPSALVGTTGLERALEPQLAGRPGGLLREGRRIIARTKPRAAPPVKTSIDVDVEKAAITALAGRLGGAAAIDPRTGEILGLAGVAYSALQPPGSTFKIITAEAALQAHMVKLDDEFPVQTGAVLEGRTLSNASGESCGGSFLHSFAESCNSVFAPLGAKVGAAKLVAAAERFGFNQPVGIPGAATSTIPPPSEIGGDLAVGSSAIGQGRVQATALQMAIVAGTVAAHGKRPVPTLELARHGGKAVDAVPRPVARTLRTLMEAVVQEGTGTAAQIPGVTVAGKTGTAELASTQPSPGQDPSTVSTVDTDAWFAAFAPADKPRIAVGVLLVQAGGGGAVAAPAAKTVREAGLKRK